MVDSLFRAMEPAADGGPKIGAEPNLLGARPAIDLRRAPRDGENKPIAGPGRGGPSVSVNDWSQMPVPLRPKEFGGHNPLNVMYVAPSLVLLPAKLALADLNAETRHAVIEALDACTLDAFQARLASTRASWRPASHPSGAATQRVSR